MDAILSALIAAMLAETGDKTQLIAAALAARYGRPGPVLAGIALAAALNAGIASTGGSWIGTMLTREAATLLLGLALVFAALGALRPAKAPDISGWRLGAFASSALAFGIAELGDKTQFLTFAIAARAELPVLAGIGTWLGVMAASAAAVAGGAAFARGARLARWGVAGILAIAGAVATVAALRLS